ncbi:LysR substrate-binding domain-containing protein [Saccharopolyspora sp. K220]|uniref:LysR family transcriptional regulator n=1 Tax=Saccharopolyspora soli TaxID=2926618 RepID=UPI001F59BD22|nr:LysR substrate-binding domain-containing protein [Saccharopolyspora soli]MCI2418249.1 LysR substrate-binding domain-containing protein [Saccharopolyspora soli]
MELRLLRHFVAVYEERSFTAAARRLHTAQPPVSQAIANLEHELGLRLFERTSRSVLPTSAADVLYPEALFLLRRAAEARTLVRGDVGRTPVRIAAVTSAFPALLPALLPELPQWDPVVVDLGSSEQRHALAAGRVDLAILREWEDPSPDQIVLADERLLLAVPVGHPLAEADTASLRGVATERIVLFARDRAPVAFDAIAAACAEAGFSAEPVAHVQSEQAMLGLVSAGLGVAIVSEILGLTPWPGVRFLRLPGTTARSPLRARVASGDPLGLLPVVARAFRSAQRALGFGGDDPAQGNAHRPTASDAEQAAEGTAPAP